MASLQILQVTPWVLFHVPHRMFGVLTGLRELRFMFDREEEHDFLVNGCGRRHWDEYLGDVKSVMKERQQKCKVSIFYEDLNDRYLFAMRVR